MILRSVVGKLWITFLVLVSFVLSILTVLLLEFFDNFHVNEAENELQQTAAKVTEIIEQYDDRALVLDVTERIKDPSSRVIISFSENDYWVSKKTNNQLPNISLEWLMKLNLETPLEQQLPNSNQEVMVVKAPLGNTSGAVFVYQSLSEVKETTKQTTKIILLGAGIAIVLTTVFAFFLSTRITSPLIKMREGAMELARGEFNTKVPILTHDEIGELAMAFNRMGRQLKFNINALSQEKEQLYSILSSMADGVITLNRKANILVTNPPAEKFLSDCYFEHDQLPSEEKVLPNELKEMFNEVILTEQETAREVSIQGRNWVVIMTPLYDQKRVRGAVAVIRDMTEERQMDQMRDDFIANVSHELRTPISMLQGYSEAIMDDIAETKEDKNELAQIIHDESLRIGRLVNELLDLARMKAGHIQLQLQPVDIQPFTNRIMKKFRGLAQDKNIELQLAFEEDLHLVIDPDRIEQVLTNLIDNAINHTNENGQVLVSIQSFDNHVQFSVKDTGTGIPQVDIPFVFERFYKADKSRKRKNGKSGTGLGLAIAKNIIDAHHGLISVQSKQDEGTTFTFTIPKNIEIA
ncbi:ATP-binding protein [Radiobacillus sp. PE A8.2]|uniref:ATP-binding protein n=1 Tax=Radiobacillus sp. PE A8.2 TaxID=3380349 RepID=UPI00388ED006